MIIPSLKTKIAAKLRGRYTVTYFPAKISSAWLQKVYHDKAEKDTGIVRVLVQLLLCHTLDSRHTHSTCLETMASMSSVRGKLS